jgi:hypothetical protein
MPSFPASPQHHSEVPRRFSRCGGARAYLFGAICPSRGTGAALVLPEVGIASMNEHLAAISRCVSVSAIALLILDGAGWHNSPKLVVPQNIVLMPLPPYAPELNSVENI